MPKKSAITASDLVQKPIALDADLSGKTFGQWKVESYAGSRNGYWFHCRCRCGVESIVHGGDLRLGRSTSCGHDGSTFKHGNKRRKADQDPTYNAWVMMRTRCNNAKRKDYKNYGGRGIRVCERWDDFAAFLADMGRRPSPRHSIDRIDNNGNYEPTNCRWATRAEQRRNSRRVISVTIDGMTMCLKDWCIKLGIPYTRVIQRIRRGTPPKLALLGKEVNPSHG